MNDSSERHAIPERLGTVEIAAQRRISRWSARRWLARLEREHGADVVQRDGRQLFTTTAALEAVMPGHRMLSEAGRVKRLEARLLRAERRIGVLDRRHELLEQRVEALEAAARRSQT